MRGIDYLSVFLLLGAAPAWQAGLDNFSAGLGSALVVLLLVCAIRTTRPNTSCSDRVQAKADSRPSTKEQI